METYTINTVIPVSIETAREYLNLDIHNFYDYLQEHIKEGTGYDNTQDILRDTTTILNQAKAIKEIDHSKQADRHIDQLTQLKNTIEQKQPTTIQFRY